jgi:phosphatidylserine/phosphatidylglycerophosphate/cardiolipin synthase-like enzyme
MNKRWPSAIALAAAAWYASDSLRHRREQGDGYDLRGEELEVGSEEFLRATEAITMAPITHGNDKEFVRQAGRAVYEQLLGGGVLVCEYCPTMIHAKTLTIDGVWSSVGSVNFDNRSFQLQDEVTLCVCSRSFAALLDEQFERDLERARRRSTCSAGTGARSSTRSPRG